MLIKDFVPPIQRDMPGERVRVKVKVKRGKGGKYKKGSKAGYQLTEEDVVYISSNTSYSEEEVREWFG